MPMNLGNRVLQTVRQKSEAGASRREILEALEGLGVTPAAAGILFDAADLILRVERHTAHHGIGNGRQ